MTTPKERMSEARRLYEAFLPSRLRQLRPASDEDLMSAADLIDALRAELDEAREVMHVALSIRLAEAERERDEARGSMRALASALVKFAPDIADMLAGRWIKANKDADEALKRFIDVMREQK